MEVRSYGLYSYGLYSYGLYSYGLYSYGRYSYGLRRRLGQDPMRELGEVDVHMILRLYIVMACIVMAYIVLAPI